MKELFIKLAPLALFSIGAGIWAAAFLLYRDSDLDIVLVACMISHFILSSCCGAIIISLHRQANIDSLTGTSNRRRFFSAISSVLKVKLPVSLIMVDIDNFKRINDTYGHLAGDEVLKQIAGVLKDNVRSTDMIARMGGEEFAIVLPRTSGENVKKMAERIRQAIEMHEFRFDSISERMTASMGITSTITPIPADDFLKCADRALLEAKKTKNAIVAYNGVNIALI